MAGPKPCARCGTGNSAEVNFCSGCGARLDSGGIAELPQLHDGGQIASGSRWAKAIPLLGALSAAAVMVAVSLTLFYAFSARPGARRAVSAQPRATAERAAAGAPSAPPTPRASQSPPAPSDAELVRARRILTKGALATVRDVFGHHTFSFRHVLATTVTTAWDGQNLLVGPPAALFFLADSCEGSQPSSSIYGEIQNHFIVGVELAAF